MLSYLAKWHILDFVRGVRFAFLRVYRELCRSNKGI
jgi:hypothetical protein